jgi:Xaa-Pro aminopeptidase
MDATRPEAAKVEERASAATQVYSNMMTLGFEQARLAYEQAQQTYAQELQALNAELGSRVQQAWGSYLETLGGAYTAAPSYEACINDYRAYLERMQALFSNAKVGEQQKAAYERYLAELADAGQDAARLQAAHDAYRGELEALWNQAPLREELSALQARYSEQLQRLAGEAGQRQVKAWEDFIARLREIWAPQELQARSEVALGRLITAAQEALVNCHAAVEKSSAKAIQELTADKA